MRYKLIRFRKGSDGKFSVSEKNLEEEPKLNFGRSVERPPALFIPRRTVKTADNSSEVEQKNPGRS